MAASGGGHLSELFHLRDRLPFDPGEVTWFTPDTPQSRSLLAGEQVVFAHDAPPRDWRAALRNARLAAAMCRRMRFGAAISTGASIAVSALPAARRHGAETAFLESAARVAGPSLSGRMLAGVPGIHTYCQSPQWADARWQYAGSVYEGFAPGPLREVPGITRVVVTLGSQRDYAFDRLVARLVEVLPADAEVLWQTGATDGSRHGINSVSTMPADELQAAMAAADLVVAHAGVGSTLAALDTGAHPVLVARRAGYGEHVDDHQLEIAAQLDGLGLATSCEPAEISTEVLLGAARRTVTRRADAAPLALW